jgi:hypothetical protein
VAQPTSQPNPLTSVLKREPKPKSPTEQITELKTLVVDYAKQETVDPLKDLGRYLGWGVGGSLLTGFGLSFMLLGLLRGLETITLFNDPTEPSGGTWSWVPYAITIVVAAIVIAAAAYVISKKAAKKRVIQ